MSTVRTAVDEISPAENYEASNQESSRMNGDRFAKTRFIPPFRSAT